MEFSPKQKEIIAHRDGNLLVSAAAGSGKTTVMVEHVIERILDTQNPCDIDRMLIVTFTKSAAAHMRDKITVALDKAHKADPENKHIERQLTLIHNACICTLDSFNSMLVSNHFNEIHLDPETRLVTNDELKLLCNETLEQFFEKKYSEEDSKFLLLVDTYAVKHSDSKLREMILGILEAAVSYPYPEEWLLESLAPYLVTTEDEVAALPFYQERVGFLKEEMKEVAALLKVAYEHASLYEFLERRVTIQYEPEFEMLEGIMALSSDEEVIAQFGTAEPVNGNKARLVIKNDPDASAVKAENDSLRKAYTTAFNNLKKECSNFSKKNILLEMQKMRPVMEALIGLTIEFYHTFADVKRENKVRDFNDTTHMALDILLHKEAGCEPEPTEVALMYRKRFLEVITDEYQDLNAVQEYLLWAVSGGDFKGSRQNRFMVGDVKQSIYAFRMARPEIFIEKYENYSEEAGASESGRKILLNQNYRSRREILDSVNILFRHLMQKEIGGIEYDEGHELHLGNLQYKEAAPETYRTELILVETKEDDTADVSFDRDDAEKAEGTEDNEGSEPSVEAENRLNQIEAESIALRIRELIDGGFPVTDRVTGELRPCTYGDICILSRDVRSWGDTMDCVLSAHNIPMLDSESTGYYDTMEIRTILNYLSILDNPQSDIPLYGVLVSVFFSFTNEEIARIRAKCRTVTVRKRKVKISLYQCLKEYSGDAALTRKIGDFFETYEKYRALVPYTSVSELIRVIVRDARYLNRMYALPNGAQRKMNLELLFIKAAQYENTGYNGLFSFVKYVKDMTKSKIETQTGHLTPAEASAVRFMTIHKSKGLEFPICILASTGKSLGGMNDNTSYILNKQKGIALPYRDYQKRVKCKSVYGEYMKYCDLRSERGEELRVLYVALTRAMEKLIIVGRVPEAAAYDRKMSSPARFDEKGRLRIGELMAPRTCYLNYIYYVAKTNPGAFTLRTIPLSGLTPTDGTGEEPGEDTTVVRIRDTEPATVLAEHEDLRRRLSFVYPYEQTAGLCSKVTVSRLKLAAMEESEIAGETARAFEARESNRYIPSFVQQQEAVSGTKRGDAYHHLCELIPYEILELSASGSIACDDAYSEHLLRLLLQNGRIKREETELINPKKLTDFLHSSLACRMKKAAEKGCLRREQPFVIAIAADRVDPSYPKEEQILMQGIVDAFFEEEDGIVIVDYKTDAVSCEQELTERYRAQLMLYAEAIEKLTKKPVTALYLYSFSLGKEVKID